MKGRRTHLYQVSYRVWDGWQYNLPGHWRSEVETIEAANIEDAYRIATRRAETPSLIAHDTVTVRKKDIVRLPDDKAKTYEVTLYYHTNVTVRVNAPSERDALLAAYAKVGGKEYERLLLEGLQEDDSPDVKEIHLKNTKKA